MDTRSRICSNANALCPIRKQSRPPMTISRDMLATFLQVVDGLSVSHAADELGVGKSVVSKRVAQLEAQVAALEAELAALKATNGQNKIAN